MLSSTVSVSALTCAHLCRDFASVPSPEMYSKTMRGFPGRSCRATETVKSYVSRRYSSGLDDGLQLRMLYGKRLARDGNNTAYFWRRDQPAQHAVTDHSRRSEKENVHA